MSNFKLNVADHNRDSIGLHYVYPVISRRAGGVSVGINLNTNNACNWRCIYCQVPDLKLGTAPPVDLLLLEHELRDFLQELLHGDFMQRRVPEEARRINDIALSGNGEPTSAREFVQVIDVIERVRTEMRVPDAIKTVLITNGSLIHRADVQAGLARMSRINGEVWLKLDRASAAGMLQVNDTRASLEQVSKSIVTAAGLCATWLQTCWFALDGKAPSLQEEDQYLELVSGLLAERCPLQGVLLYTLARPSLQAEAPRLAALSLQQMQHFARRIEQLGLKVKISV